MAALKAVYGEKVTWDSACSCLLEENRFKSMVKRENMSKDSNTLRAVTVRRKISQSRKSIYNCNKLGYMLETVSLR